MEEEETPEYMDDVFGSRTVTIFVLFHKNKMEQPDFYRIVNKMMNSGDSQNWSFGSVVMESNTPFGASMPRLIFSVGWRSNRGIFELCNASGTRETVNIFFDTVGRTLGYQPQVLNIVVPMGTIYISLL